MPLSSRLVGTGRYLAEIGAFNAATFDVEAGFAGLLMAFIAADALIRAGGLDEVGLVIPHQAKLRIIEALAREMGLERDRVYGNIDRYGNAGAGTLPIALDEARVRGTLPPPDAPVLHASFRAGATASAAVMAPGGT